MWRNTSKNCKKMKNNLIAWLLTLSMTALCLTGCGGSTADSPAEGSGGKPEKPGEAVTEVSEEKVYIPADFHVSGGTGRVVITCPEVRVSDGAAEALLNFDSEHYTYVKVDGEEYDRQEDSPDNTSLFYIPVALDQEMTILAQTTAMSTPHEVEYRIYISSEASDGSEETKTVLKEEGAKKSLEFSDPASLPGLTLVSQMENSYADCFTVSYYEGGYKFLQVKNSAEYLLVPEGADTPEGLPSDIVVLQAPLDHIYMAATSAMSLFFAMGAEDSIILTGTNADGWNIEGPGDAIRAGKMQYAGKYSAPDFELMVGSGCDLAVESTMILHSPDIKEKLEDLGIPVFIDNSSYENEPLGRTEWIRLYGALLDREEEADAFFRGQEEIISGVEEAVKEKGGSEKSRVAVFAITTSGTVTVRRSDDYIPRMIEIAGGSYIFDSLTNEETRGGTATISMEEFYNAAAEADYIIYNSTIEGKLSGVDALLEKSSLFSDFKAVKEGKVWQIGKDLYQSTDTAGLMTEDLFRMLSGEEEGMAFLEKLN